MNPQAEELNIRIKNHAQTVYNMLSERGKAIFFPKKGIPGQTADAKGKRINATIGAAVEADGSPMRLGTIESQINISPELAFPYASNYGRPDIRKKWQEMIVEKNPSLKGKEISLPIVTNALTHALSVLGYMFLDANDTILVPDLFWGNYNLIFTNAYGAAIEKFKTFNENGFDLQSFEKAVAGLPSKKKVILLNFPNNPTGYSPTKEEVKGIVSIILKEAEKGNQMLVATDDAYFGLVYEEGIEKESLFAHLAHAHENILGVKIDGPTKEDYVWGFRVGFISYGHKNGNRDFYDALESKTAGAVRGNISNASNLSQSLLLNAYNHPNYKNEKEEKYKILKGRYDKVKEALRAHKFQEYFTPLPYNSGYFMCLKIKEGLDGEKIRQILLEKYDTGIINLNNILRLAFSSVAEEDIQELFDNVYNACKDSLS